MAKTITVTLSNTEEKILQNELADPEEWVKRAAEGKINNVWKRMQTEWTTRLMNDDSFTDPIPSNQADFIALVTSRDDYQTCTERAANEANSLIKDN